MEKPAGPEPDVTIDEKWLMEWFEFGWAGPKGLIEYMTNHALFDAFCADHDHMEPA